MKSSCYEAWNQALQEYQIKTVQFFRCRARYPPAAREERDPRLPRLRRRIDAAKLTTTDGITGWGQLSTDIREAKKTAELLTGRPLTELFHAGNRNY